MRKLKILMVVSAAAMLSSCDLTQIPGVTGKLSLEDSKAVGAACRHSGRALEDCFTLNPTSTQAGVFEGWREMNDYMLANEIEVVKPEIKTSAYPPEPESSAKDAAPKDADSNAPVKNPHAGPAPSDPPPPASGRQRWTPRGAGDAQAPPGNAQPAPEQKMTEAAPKQEPPAPPARPWERKKDPKNHT